MDVCYEWMIFQRTTQYLRTSPTPWFGSLDFWVCLIQGVVHALREACAEKLEVLEGLWDDTLVANQLRKLLVRNDSHD